MLRFRALASVDSDSGSSFGGLPCHCSEDILVDGIVVAAAAAVEAEGVVEGRAYALAINRLGGRIQTGSGSLDALFRFTDEEPPQLGRTITLTVKLPAKSNVIALPNAAVRNGDRVYRVVENYLESIAVQRIGEYRGDDGESLIIVASDDIANDDRIITSQLTSAVDGMKVQVRQ